MARLRQAVLVARDLDAAVGALRGELALGEAFRDPDVGHFGLRNAVMALGDTFLEVVSPVRDGAAAGRHLDRLGGDGGYMLMFEVPDVAAARRRAAAQGVREVFSIELPDITDVHLHPRDMGGAIVAIDQPRPPGSWRWAGPAWAGAVPAHPPGGVRGATVLVADPEAVARRWAHVLGVPVDAHAPQLRLDGGGAVRFAAGGPDRIAGLDIDAGRDGEAEVGGVRLRLTRA